MTDTNDEHEVLRQQVFAIVRAIPQGGVLSYGEVGALCDPPISGYICGRIMACTPDDIPWWRVVGKDGALPIRKRHPHLAIEQRRRLQEEGVSFSAENKIQSRKSSASLFDTD